MSAPLEARLFTGEGYREPEPVTIQSFGGGQDSFAIALKLIHDNEFRHRYAPGRLLLVMSDTGAEHDETYAFVRTCEKLCEERGVEFHFLIADRGFHTENWSSLTHFYESGARIGSKSYPRSCTQNLKLSPFYKFLEHKLSAEYGVALGSKRGLKQYSALAGKIRVLIGIAADEARRRINPDEKVPPWMAQSIERLYPLVDLGWDREDCQDYIRSLGFEPPPPSLCKFCPFKSEQDILYMHRFMPADYERWVGMEKAKLEAHADRFRDLPQEKNHGVFGSGSTLPQVLEKATEKYGHMSDEELYEHRMNHGHAVASKY